MPHFKIVLTYRRRASVVFIYSFSKFPFCLPDVMGVTVVTFYVIDHSSLISFGDFVFGVNKIASKVLKGFR